MYYLCKKEYGGVCTSPNLYGVFMKKACNKILLCIISLLFVFTSLVGCGGDGWDSSKVTLNPDGAGNVKTESLGGFIAETDNYVYFINGVGDSSEDNTFGNTIKGALVGAKKGTDGKLTDTCVVVPKLFVASDYKAGLFIDGGYVYYGTPNTDRDSSGEIAKSELVIAKTKLDGTGFESFLVLPSLSTEYRFVKGGDTVYVVYYDATEQALISFNTNTKDKTVIVKTSNENASESLTSGGYKLVGDANCAVVYTVDVYADEFNQTAKDEQGDSYTRATENYNKVYAYKVGATQSDLIVNGDANIDKKYSIKLVKGGYVFLTETDNASNPTTRNYAVKIDEDMKMTDSTLIARVDYIADSNVMKSLTEIYSVADGFIVKVDATNATNDYLEYVAKATTFGTLLFKDGDFIYYTNSNNQLARIYVGADRNKEEKDLIEQRVSESTINTSWYAPELVNGKVFYIDNSSKGLSYVKYVPVSADLEVEKDDDGNITLCYLKGSEDAGVILGEDKAKKVEEQINEISSQFEGSKFVFDKDDKDNDVLTDGKPQVKAIKDARDAYEALGENKKYLSDSALTTLEKYEKALELNQIFYALKDFDTLDKAGKDAKRDAFDKATNALEQIESDGEFTLSDMRSMLAENFNYFYQQADKHFNPTQD